MGTFGTLDLGLGLTIRRAGSSPFELEALDLFNRFTTQPTYERKLLINTLIKSLKTAGVWAKLDALYLLAAADGQAARRNWIADQYNLASVSSPAFTVDRGYTGDGTGAYLDTGFTPSTAAAAKYTQNAACAGIWNRTARAAAPYSDMGAIGSTTNRWLDVQPRISGSGTDRFAHAANSAYSLPLNSNSQGNFTVVRTSSTTIIGYVNGTQFSSATISSAGLPNASIAILARGAAAGGANTFSADQIAAGYFGGALSAPEITALQTALSAYLTAVGAI